MKLMIFPEARRHQVETVVREALGHHAGNEELTLTIVRMSATNDWTVHATGLGDRVLETSYCDVIRDALRRAGI